MPLNGRQIVDLGQPGITVDDERPDSLHRYQRSILLTRDSREVTASPIALSIIPLTFSALDLRRRVLDPDGSCTGLGRSQ